MRKTHTLKIAACATCFIFLFQTFFYVNDAYYIYIFQKIALPLAGLAVATIAIPLSLKRKTLERELVYLPLIYFALIITSALGSSYYHSQPFLYSMAAEGKLLSSTSIFLTLFALKTIRPNEKEIELAVKWISLVFLLLFTYLHITVEVESAWTKESQIYVNDSKGFRLRLPSFFIVILAIMSAIEHSKEKSLLSLLSLASCIAYLLIFQQQRMELLSLCIVLALIYTDTMHSKSRNSIKILAALGLAVTAIYSSQIILETLSTDASLLTRASRLEVIIEFFKRSDLISLLLGAGEINSAWADKLTLLGTEFSAGDYGWIGIAYEFGILGLLLLVFATIISITIKTDKQSKVQSTLKYYIYTFSLLSITAPHIAYTPGILMSSVATIIYLRNQKNDIKQL